MSSWVAGHFVDLAIDLGLQCVSLHSRRVAGGKRCSVGWAGALTGSYRWAYPIIMPHPALHPKVLCSRLITLYNLDTSV